MEFLQTEKHTSYNYNNLTHPLRSHRHFQPVINKMATVQHAMLGIGGAAIMGWVSTNIIQPNYAAMKSFFLTELVLDNDQFLCYNVQTYIEEKCRDDLSTIQIQGEDLSTKNKEDGEELLSGGRNDNTFETRVPYSAPFRVNLKHGVFDAIFFRLCEKNGRVAYIAVFRNGGPTLFNMLIPKPLQRLYELLKTIIVGFLKTQLGEDTFNTLSNLFRKLRTLPRSNQTGTAHRGNNGVSLVAFRRDADMLHLFIQEVVRQQKSLSSLSTKIVSLSERSYVFAPPRPPDTIAFEPGSGAFKLKNRIKKFWHEKGLYEQIDQPYQMVFLLHGPPGNGKSSYLQSIALEHEIPYFIVKKSLFQKSSIEELSRHFDITLNRRCLVVIEDAESCFIQEHYTTSSSSEEQNAATPIEPNHEPNTTHGNDSGGADGVDGVDAAAAAAVDDLQQSRISVDDFIKCIRGQTPAGRLIFFTTNKLDALPNEITDFVNSSGISVEFPKASRAILSEYWNMFFKDATTVHFENFIEHYAQLYQWNSQRVHSVAQMQGYCMRFRDHPEEASKKENILSFAAADTATMKRYWFSFFSEQEMHSQKVYWKLFISHYNSLYRSEVKDQTGSNEKLIHSLQTLRSYLLQFVHAPKKASEKENVCSFTAVVAKEHLKEHLKVTSSGTVVDLTPMSVPVSRATTTPKRSLKMSSLFAARTFKMARADATEIMDHHVIEKTGERDETRAWNAVRQEAQRRDQIVDVKPVSSALLEHLSTILSSVVVTGFGFFVATFFPAVLKSLGMTQNSFNVTLFLPSIYAVFISYHRRRMRFKMENFIVINNGKIMRALKFYFATMISSKSSKFFVKDSYSQDAPLPPSLRNFSEIGNVYGGDTSIIKTSVTKNIGILVNATSSTKRIVPSINIWMQAQFDSKQFEHDDANTTTTFPFEFKLTNNKIRIKLARTKGSKKRIRAIVEDSLKMYALENSLEQSVLRNGKMITEKRQLESSFLWPIDNEQTYKSLQNMLASAEEFDHSRMFYRQRGIPFRRGYLLVGPPRSGKMFTVKMLASRLSRGIIEIDMCKKYCTDNFLIDKVQRYSREILVLKNIDLAVSPSFGGAGRATGEGRSRGQSNLSFTGILNILDGPFANNSGLIVIMIASNYAKLTWDEATSGALLRPGRVAMTMATNRPTKHQLFEMFKSFPFIEKVECKDDDSMDTEEDSIQVTDTEKDRCCQEFFKILDTAQKDWYKRANEDDAGVEKKDAGGEKKHAGGETKEQEENNGDRVEEVEDSETQEELAFSNFITCNVGHTLVRSSAVGKKCLLCLNICNAVQNKYRCSKGCKFLICEDCRVKKIQARLNEEEEMKDISMLEWWKNGSHSPKTKMSYSIQLNWEPVKNFLKECLDSIQDTTSHTKVNACIAQNYSQERKRLNLEMGKQLNKLSIAGETALDTKTNIQFRESVVFDAKLLYLEVFTPMTGLATLSEVQEECHDLYVRMEMVRRHASLVAGRKYFKENAEASALANDARRKKKREMRGNNRSGRRVGNRKIKKRWIDELN